ncbi:MAG: helix-turn-helix transcriptional regulator [Candidatus Aenigmarchaeota archaeon]|nr:helix-turn-helix transcriptional regulator [Candidatus Aenigmarchaeota archaeon]
MVKRHIDADAVYRIISMHWPLHVTEIAEKMGFPKEEKEATVSHLCYHVKALVNRGLVRSKRVGKALVVWPSDVENIKAVRSLFY